MAKLYVKILFSVLLFSSAACTQSPVSVELKGHNAFNRNGATSTFAFSGGDSNTVQAAPVSMVSSQPASGSIGVSDLAPAAGPSTKPIMASDAPFSHADTTHKLPAGTVVSSTNVAKQEKPHVNLWTGKPKEQGVAKQDVQSFNIRPQATAKTTEKELMVSEIKKPVQTAGSQLDSVISSSGATKKATVAITKPVKTEMLSSGAFMWPVNSKKIISQYGPKGKGKVNDGINIASADGEPVWASSDGEVVYVGNELQGYGNMVLIKHAGDKATTYAHMSRITVEKYSRIKQGDIIGYVGTTGNVKEPQLHFAVREGRDAVDPMKYLSRKVASNQ